MILLEKTGLEGLLKILSEMGYKTIGPTLQDSAITLRPIDSIMQLPRGYKDEQAPGSYRLKKASNDYFFNFASGPHSLKLYLHPPAQRLYKVTMTAKGLGINAESQTERYAFLAVRACDIKALEALDLALRDDLLYSKKRENIFIVALNCAFPSDVCFCSSMDAGPEVKKGFDVLLTEFEECFLFEAGTEKGHAVMKRLSGKIAGKKDIDKKAAVIESALSHIKKSLNREGLPHKLYRELENPHWQDIAKRDLSCGNCTMVCPTCFCSTTADMVGLDISTAERLRRWDSCFSVGFARVHGGNFRPSLYARYRQWMLHKLSYWIDQYGVSGCVGCGRCITWCPAGIDITEEYSVITG